MLDLFSDTAAVSPVSAVFPENIRSRVDISKILCPLYKLVTQNEKECNINIWIFSGFINIGGDVETAEKNFAELLDKAK